MTTITVSKILLLPDLSCSPINWCDNQDIEFDLPEPEELRMEIIDLAGKVVYHRELITTSGRNSFDLNLSTGLSKSVYLVQLTGAKTHICKKLVFAD